MQGELAKNTIPQRLTSRLENANIATSMDKTCSSLELSTSKMPSMAVPWPFDPRQGGVL